MEQSNSPGQNGAPPLTEEPDKGKLVREVESETKVGGRSPKTIMRTVVVGVYVLLIGLGIGTGYLLSGKKIGLSGAGQAPGVVKTDGAVGSADTKTFKDSADGVIEKGGLDGEGTHKLVREGGPSQTAFLISSVIDLDSYLGKKVRVWGQTFAAEKAAWLMDVGKIEVLKE